MLWLAVDYLFVLGDAEACLYRTVPCLPLYFYPLLPSCTFVYRLYCLLQCPVLIPYRVSRRSSSRGGKSGRSGWGVALGGELAVVAGLSCPPQPHSPLPSLPSPPPSALFFFFFPLFCLPSPAFALACPSLPSLARKAAATPLLPRHPSLVRCSSCFLFFSPLVLFIVGFVFSTFFYFFPFSLPLFCPFFFIYLYSSTTILSSSISLHLPPSRIASTLVTLWLVLVLVAVYSLSLLSCVYPATSTSPRFSAIADFNLWPKREIEKKKKRERDNHINNLFSFFFFSFFLYPSLSPILLFTTNRPLCIISKACLVLDSRSPSPSPPPPSPSLLSPPPE